MKGKITILFFMFFCLFLNAFAVSIVEIQAYLPTIGYTSQIQGEYLVITPNNCFQKYAYDLIEFFKWFMSVMAVFVLINVFFKYWTRQTKDYNIVPPLKIIAICLLTVWGAPYAVGFITNTKISYECEKIEIKISDLGKNDLPDLLRFYSK